MTDMKGIRKEAVKVLYTELKANNWLNSIHLEYGVSPMKLLGNHDGAAKVKQVLGAIKFGGVI